MWHGDPGFGICSFPVSLLYPPLLPLTISTVGADRENACLSTRVLNVNKVLTMPWIRNSIYEKGWGAYFLGPSNFKILPPSQLVLLLLFTPLRIIVLCLIAPTDGRTALTSARSELSELCQPFVRLVTGHFLPAACLVLLSLLTRNRPSPLALNL